MSSDIDKSAEGDTTAGIIRDAALRCFALHGVERTSLREVANDAGISIGAVQHSFGTKGRLVEAVEAYCGEAMQELFQPTPTTTDGRASIDEVGQSVKRLLVEYPHVAGYAVRSMIDGTSFGASIFDQLLRLGDSRWRARDQQGLLDANADPRWASLNSLLVGIGGILMRSHLDRHLPEPFISPRMQSQWVDSLNTLFRQGYLISGPHPPPSPD